MGANFNPHENRTTDGTLIVPGLRVVDYDRKVGVVVDDSDMGVCEYRPDCTDHWFDVKREDGVLAFEHEGTTSGYLTAPSGPTAREERDAYIGKKLHTRARQLARQAGA